MIRKFIAAFMIIFFAAMIHTMAFAADKPEVFQVTGGGQAPSNWDQRDSFAKTFARQAARMDALRQLAEIVSGVIIHTSIEVDPDGNLKKDYFKSELVHNSKVFKLLEKNARQVGDAKFYFTDDGVLMCEINMEVVVPTDWKKAELVVSSRLCK